MSHGRPGAAERVEVSLVPVEGWHCSHLYYRWDRGALAAMSPAARRAARAELAQILNPDGPLAPSRLQTSVVSGHKADFGLMLMDAHPLKIEAVNQALLSSRFLTHGFQNQLKEQFHSKAQSCLSHDAL